MRTGCPYRPRSFRFPEKLLNGDARSRTEHAVICVDRLAMVLFNDMRQETKLTSRAPHVLLMCESRQPLKTLHACAAM